MRTATDNPLRADPELVVELEIDLEAGDTALEDCRRIPAEEYGPGAFYHSPGRPLSVAQLPPTGLEYVYGCSIVSRQNARFAERRGFRYERIDRADWEDDLYELRSSSPHRQGRAMPPSYMRRERYSSDRWPEVYCRRHLATVHGVIGPDGRLAAYCQIVQCGEVARFNTILGHADRLGDRVVWLLVLSAIRWHIDEIGARFALYYEHDSGHGSGLRYFKERLGFRPARVSWGLE